MSERRKHDVIVIGAGVVGAAIAWRLSKERHDVLWLESESDVAEGASKANSGIACTGYDCEPGTLEVELVRASSGRWERVCADLDVPFRRTGALALARNGEEVAGLEGLRRQAQANRVKAKVLSREELRRRAPYVTPEALAALSVPREGIVDPIRLTLGYAKLAVQNGVRLLLDTPVTRLVTEKNKVVAVQTPSGSFGGRYLVCAAGLFTDEVLEGGFGVSIRPRKGEFLIVDKEDAVGIDAILTTIPGPFTRGVLLVPTTHGALLVGPNAVDHEDKADRSTDPERLEGIWEQALHMVPALRREGVIKTFAGNRPAAERQYQIEVPDGLQNLVIAAGFRSTGVSSSLAVADRVRELLGGIGLDDAPDPSAHDAIEPMPRLSDAVEWERLVAEDPRYRLVVCLCERVTAGEIEAAFDGPVPARSIDGVKKRTRAGWGRCQGSLCMAGVSFLASQRLGCPPWELPVSARGGTVGVGEAAHG